MDDIHLPCNTNFISVFQPSSHSTASRIFFFVRPCIVVSKLPYCFISNVYCNVIPLIVTRTFIFDDFIIRILCVVICRICLRRVEQQNDFITHMSHQARAVFNCLLDDKYPTWFDMDSRCIPTNISSHYHYAKFTSIFPRPNSLRKPLKRKSNESIGRRDSLDYLNFFTIIAPT